MTVWRGAVIVVLAGMAWGLLVFAAALVWQWLAPVS